MSVRLQGVYEGAGRLAYSIVLLLQFIHSQFVQPTGALFSAVLDVWEESCKVRCRTGLGRFLCDDGE